MLESPLKGGIRPFACLEVRTRALPKIVSRADDVEVSNIDGSHCSAHVRCGEDEGELSSGI